MSSPIVANLPEVDEVGITNTPENLDFYFNNKC
jgi:hypothetical protein